MKCPINEIQDDLTRNMAWELFKTIEYCDLRDLYCKYRGNARLPTAIRGAVLKKIQEDGRYCK